MLPINISSFHRQVSEDQSHVFGEYHRQFDGKHHRFVGELNAPEDRADAFEATDTRFGQGGIIESRIVMESVIRVIPKHTTLVLSLYGPDRENFPWEAVVRRYKLHAAGKHNSFADVSRIRNIKLLTEVNGAASLPLLITLPGPTQ